MPLTANNQFVDDVSCSGGYERAYFLRWVSLRAQKKSLHPFNDCTKYKSPGTMSYLASCKFITSILSGQHYSCSRSCKSHLSFQIRIVIIIFFKFRGMITNRYYYHYFSKYYGFPTFCLQFQVHPSFILNVMMQIGIKCLMRFSF